MATRKPTDTDLKTLKECIIDLFSNKYKKDFNILITGKIGVGKSSLINALMGMKVAKEGRERAKLHETTETSSYDCVIEGIQLRVWDSPGFQNDQNDDDSNLEDMIKKLENEDLDLVIYCLRMDDTRFQTDDKTAMEKLTEKFGKELWKHSVIALTFADKIGHPEAADQLDFFRRELKSWKDALRVHFTKIDPNIFQSLPIVPTAYGPKRKLPDDTRWLIPFWIACYKAAKNKGAFNLFVMCHSQIPALHIAPLRLLGGISANNDPSSAPEDVDPLSSEETESILKKTWEIIKEFLKDPMARQLLILVGFAVLKMLN